MTTDRRMGSTAPILLSPPDTGATEETAVLRALRGGWVAPLGPEVDAFERELASYVGRRYAVALSSGTSALHLALLHWGVGPGDVVVTSTMTFAATANAIAYTGAQPAFVDCDSTGNIDVELLAEALTRIEATGKRIAAIVPVDVLGKVADYEHICQLASRVGAPVLADSAESLGAYRAGRPAGSFGEAAVLSFNGNKVMTTSGGGALLTDDAGMADRVRYLASQARQPVRHYEHTEIGYNYRLSNILAALGRAQLSRLDEMIEKRRRNRVLYRELFAGISGTEVFGAPDGAEDPLIGETRDNFWLTSVLVDSGMARGTADGLISFLSHLEIEARPLWKPMHLQPVYRGSLAYLNGNSERLFTTGVSLPSGSNLSPTQRSRIHEAIRVYFEV